MLTVFTFSLVITLILSVFASWKVIRPFISTEYDEMTKEQVDQQTVLGNLLIRKETLLTALEDLEQDFTVAKISEQEYYLNKRELTAQTASCLEKISIIEQHSSNASS